MTDAALTAGGGLAVADASQRVPAMRHRVRGGVLGLLCGFYALSYIDRVNISTAAPFIKGELGLTDTRPGLVLSAFALPAALLQMPGGWIGDRVGARRALRWLACVWAGATTGAAFAAGVGS